MKHHKFNICADGFDFEFTYKPQDYSVPHLELRTKGANPLTETGYRSIFLPHEEVKTPPQIERFAQRLLDDARLTPEWNRIKGQLNQLDLFS